MSQRVNYNQCILIRLTIFVDPEQLNKYVLVCFDLTTSTVSVHSNSMALALPFETRQLAECYKSLNECTIKHHVHSLDICIDIQLYQGYSITVLFLIPSWLYLIHSIARLQDVYLVILYFLTSLKLEDYIFTYM